MVMLVVLSCSHVKLAAEKLRAQFKELFPGNFLKDGDDGSFVIDGPRVGMQAFVKSIVPRASGFFIINSVPGPYDEVSPAPRTIVDAALRDCALAQTCWLSVDFVHTWATDAEAAAYRFIAPVTALLAPPDAAVLLHPSTQGAVGFEETVRARLAAGEIVV